MNIRNIMRVAHRMTINGIYNFGIWLQRAFFYTVSTLTVIGAISAATIVAYEHYMPRHVTVVQRNTIYRVVSIDNSAPTDQRLLAATMWAEARGEGITGMKAVGHVIINRLDSHRFGNSLQQVVFHPNQFSSWNSNDVNDQLLQSIDANPPTGRDLEMWMIAQTLARDILEGHSTDPTEGALFYHDTSVNPRWAKPNLMLTQIGTHIFYSNAG